MIANSEGRCQARRDGHDRRPRRGAGSEMDGTPSERLEAGDPRVGRCGPAELEREQAYVSMLQALLDRDALVARHADRLARLEAVERGLCFGRLDRRDRSRMYVGRLGLFDDESEPLLVDWRAPAAQPFYRATPAAPGDVVRRRHLR